MELFVSIAAVLFAWRFLASLVVVVLFSIPVGQMFGAGSAPFVVLVGVGFGCIWQGRWLSGIPLFSSVPAPPISKPVAFLGFAFVGAIWGGIVSEILGSPFAGVFALVASVAAMGAWYTLFLKRHDMLGNLMFSAVSLLFGFGSLYALSTFRV